MPDGTVKLTVSGPSETSVAGLAEGAAPARSLYMHVPFCFHKCHYCDFYSFVDTQDRQAPFVGRLIDEVRTLARHASSWEPGGRARLETVFIGGGTPSLLRVDLWQVLLGALHDSFALSADSEFTVECNPETVTPELMAVLRAGGVNRVSIGSQSSDPRHLKTLERWHEPASVGRALALAGGAGIERRSIDLIFGIPGQTLDEWRRELFGAINLGVEHISCYSLTYEPNTAMTKRLGRGDFNAAPEELEKQMFDLTVEILRDYGLDRYEVSNFARSGAECRHNLAYWRQDQWLAAGPSASAHIAGHRWKNVPRLSEWMDGVEASAGYSPIVDHEPPDARRALAERIMTGLRLAEGLDSAAMLECAEAFGARASLGRVAAKYHRGGNLLLEDGRWRLTDAGYWIADGIAAEMMAALDE